MTTEKQAAANKENAKKSTGAKTPEGKAIVAGNAVKHGLFSRRLILAGESVEEYNQLLDDLFQSFRPAGAGEQILVEKICSAIWRQMRLTRAESASIELSRRTEQYKVKNMIEQALAVRCLSDDDFEPLTADEIEHLSWCEDVLAQYEAIPDSVLDDSQLAELKAQAPAIYEQLEVDFGQDKKKLEDPGGAITLRSWADDLVEYCKGIVTKLERRPKVQAMAGTVQDYFSAPIGNELLQKYQMALDGELYRAMEALRKQQEHRVKMGVVIESETV